MKRDISNIILNDPELVQLMTKARSAFDELAKYMVKKAAEAGVDLPAEWTEYMNPRGEGFSANGPGVTKFDGYFEPHDHDIKDEELTDWHSTDYCIERLGKKHDKPLIIPSRL